MDGGDWFTSSEIAAHVRVTSGTVLYHLYNMEREDIVERKAEERGWRLGPYKQKNLTEFVTKPRKRLKKKKK